jgi:hypothetical protein
MDEGHVVKAEKSQDAPKIGFLKIEDFRRAVSAVEAATAGDDEDLLALKQAFGAGGGVAEGATGARNMIDPRLQR